MTRYFKRRPTRSWLATDCIRRRYRNNECSSLVVHGTSTGVQRARSTSTPLANRSATPNFSIVVTKAPSSRSCDWRKALNARPGATARLRIRTRIVALVVTIRMRVPLRCKSARSEATNRSRSCDRRTERPIVVRLLCVVTSSLPHPFCQPASVRPLSANMFPTLGNESR